MSIKSAELNYQTEELDPPQLDIKCYCVDSNLLWCAKSPIIGEYSEETAGRIEDFLNQHHKRPRPHLFTRIYWKATTGTDFPRDNYVFTGKKSRWKTHENS